MQSAASEPNYPRNRAFKVQLHAAAAGDNLSGRVVDMGSGEVRTFDSLEALYEMFRDSLGSDWR